MGVGYFFVRLPDAFAMLDPSFVRVNRPGLDARAVPVYNASKPNITHT